MNQSRVKIKICGITDAAQAYTIARMGAAQIGIILAANSSRCVSTEQAKMIAKSAMSGGAQAVLVVTEHSIEEIDNICQECGVDQVQLHNASYLNDNSREKLKTKKIFVHQDAKLDFSHYQQLLKPNGDHLLIENIANQNLSKEIISNLKASTLRYYIAGNINEHNVLALIEKYQPYAVDLCSALESAPGVKDLTLVNSFIKTVAARRMPC